MTKIRIYELAKELGLENKVVIAKAAELGLKGKTSHSNSLTDEEVRLLRRSFMRLSTEGIVVSGEMAGAKTGARSRVVVKRETRGPEVRRVGVVTRDNTAREGFVVAGESKLSSTKIGEDGTDSAPRVVVRPFAIKQSADVESQTSNADEGAQLSDISIEEDCEISAVAGDDSCFSGQESLTEEIIIDSSAQGEENSNESCEISETDVDTAAQEDSDYVVSSNSDDEDRSLVIEDTSENEVGVGSELSTDTSDENLGDIQVDEGDSDSAGEGEFHTAGSRLGKTMLVDPAKRQVRVLGRISLTKKSQPKVETPPIVEDTQEVQPVRQPLANVFRSPMVETKSNSQSAYEATLAEIKARREFAKTGELDEEEGVSLEDGDDGRSENKVSGPKILGRIELSVKSKGQSGAKKVADKKNKKGKGESVEDFEEEERNSKKRRNRFKDSRYDYEDGTGYSRNRKKGEKHKVHEFTGPKESKRVVKMGGEGISVGDLAHQMSLKAGDVIGKLMGMGVMANINQLVDQDTATLVAMEYGYSLDFSGFDESTFIVDTPDPEDSLVPRAPVVTVMGHVDHGKTSLLDRIRSASVASGEHGGITQHIGAYQVVLEGNRRMTFLDTPGHAAFTAMRARGASITDVVILVVAADDGVMPQTLEALNHAVDAGVPIVVAVNKMDKVDANPDKVKQQLAERGLQPDDWGGDTMFVPVSAVQGTGISQLLEAVLLVSELRDLKANPNRRAFGTVIEASQEVGRGTVATVLVQKGTLRVGDYFVSGVVSGRVRSMNDERGERVAEALPSWPVEISGFDGIPEAGDEFVVMESESDAKKLVGHRAERQHWRDNVSLGNSMSLTLEDFAKVASSGEAVELRLILKTDVQGSLEAVNATLMGIESDKVSIKIIHKGVGPVTESDVQLALASSAIVVAFGVRADTRASSLAEEKGIDIRFYRVIYNLVDDIKKAMIGLLLPDKEEVPLGKAEVRETFYVSKVGVVAGCYVTDGKVQRGAFVRVVRDGFVMAEEKILSGLRRFKDDVKEVQSGYECGISVDNFPDVKQGDLLTVYELRDVEPTL